MPIAIKGRNSLQTGNMSRYKSILMGTFTRGCFNNFIVPFEYNQLYFPSIVHGNWGQWHEWTPNECPVTCGGSDQSRTRECDDPAPFNGGNDCSVDGSTNIDIKRCNEDLCPGSTLFCYGYRHVPNFIFTIESSLIND